MKLLFESLWEFTKVIGVLVGVGVGIFLLMGLVSLGLTYCPEVTIGLLFAFLFGYGWLCTYEDMRFSRMFTDPKRKK